LADAHPEWKYRLYPADIYANHRDFNDDFFQIRVDPETKLYLSEDYFFVQEARKIGFQTYVVPNAVTGHVGAYEYKLNLPLVAASGLNIRGMIRSSE